MKFRSLVAGVGALALAVGACDDSTTAPAGEDARLTIAFRADAGAASGAMVPAFSASTAARSVDLVGTNGTLTLDEVRLVVAEIELEREDDGDCFETDDDDCEEFSAGPQFVALDLDGAAPFTVAQDVPPGVYEELEFEVEDLEVDDDDDDDRSGEIVALLADIRAQFPNWPEEASMMVTGSFTPTGGTAVAFSVFFEAEIEIEMEFQPPLDLTAGEIATAAVVVDPTLWFANGDGTVLDLSQFQGQLVEFEAEIENGFVEIELDDDD